jgi:hypothetical protein
VTFPFYWHGEIRNAYKMLVGKIEAKRPFGRTKHRWEGNIKMYLKGIGWGWGCGLDLCGSE